MRADATNRATISPPDIQAALARVAGSGLFSRSGQLQRLLRFVVEETLAGRSERLKEYVIGVEVFGRPVSYDPRLDSLVRVEARRLRSALLAYYVGEGRADAVVIDLPKGSYVPSFRRATPAGGTGVGSSSGSPAATQRKAGVALTVLLVVGLVAAAAIVPPLFRPKRAAVLTERDLVLLAGFSNSTGEPIFDETLQQGLTSELEQSPFLNIVSERRVRQVLKLMGRAPSDRVPRELARETCVRAGSQAMVEGSIARLGARYVIGLTATSCATGDAFAHVQVQAASRETVLEALSRAAADMRGRLGESLASIRRFDVPIEDATTASLEALQAYSRGRETAREKGSPADIPFYQRAIEIDPGFAVAYAALGVSYVNLGQPSAAAGHLEKAYRLRDRVSEREKYRISAYYHHVVNGELEKANEVYGLWKQSYPRDVAPYINIGIIHTWLGEYEASLAETNEALRLEPGNVLPYSNVAAAYIKLGRLDEASAVLQQAASRSLTSKFVRSNLGYLAFLRRDTATMERQLAEVRDSPGDEDPLLSQQADTEAYFGRLRNARRLSQDAVRSALRTNAKEAAAGWLANAALREAEYGARTEARTLVDQALGLAPGRDVLALAALASARAGDAARAEHLLRDLETTYPLNTVIRVYWAPTIRAAVAIARGTPGHAVECLRAASPYDLASPPPIGLATLYPVYVRGDAYLRARNGAGAAAEFQKILGHPGLVLNFPLHALAHWQLGRARALTGDQVAARQSYDRFFTLWNDADIDIPVLAGARAEYARLR